jgi:virulence-associated protein VapD
MPTIGHNSRARGSMFAIVFDLDTNSLKEVYGGPSWNNAYSEVRNFLKRRGFGWQQGSTYFGDETVDAVNCVLTIQDLTAEFDWFAPSVRDIRMLRIEDNNDLRPAVERAARRKDG